MAAHIDRVKLVVVGDSGVGKSTFINGIVNQVPFVNPSSTIGCNVEVLEYPYNEGGHQRDVFLEFWEVGGASGHRNSRSIFYANVNGLIVVHDLANRKSFLNLQKWVREVLNAGRQELTGVTVNSDRDDLDSDFVGTSGSIPVLVLGTKEDLSYGDQSGNRSARHIGLTENSDVFFCDMNCLQQGQLVTNSNKWTQLHAFFSKVVENRFYLSKKSLVQDTDYWRSRKKIF